MSFKTPGISARRIRICRSQSGVTCCQISFGGLLYRHHRRSEHQDSNLQLVFTALAPSRSGRYSKGVAVLQPPVHIERLKFPNIEE